MDWGSRGGRVIDRTYRMGDYLHTPRGQAKYQQAVQKSTLRKAQKIYITWDWRGRVREKFSSQGFSVHSRGGGEHEGERQNREVCFESE